MAKRKIREKLSSKIINLNYYDIYKINKDESIIYRCKFCYKSRIKKK